MNFSIELLNEALRSPNHKTCFSFALRCTQDLHQARPFWCGWVETGLNGQKLMGKCKFCMHLRAKLIRVLWLGDLKAALKNAAAKSIHNTSSSTVHSDGNPKKFWRSLAVWPKS